MAGWLRLLLIALTPALVTALSPISVKGTKFYDDDGEQFFIKGRQSRVLSSVPSLTR